MRYCWDFLEYARLDRYNRYAIVTVIIKQLFNDSSFRFVSNDRCIQMETAIQKL